MTTKARRAPAGAEYPFPLSFQGASAGAESRGIRQRFPYQCNKTKDRQDSRTEVIVEPGAASPPEPLAGEDYFCQDKLY